MTAGFVLVAAGEGRRLGSALPKALVDLAGQTLLERALAVLLEERRFVAGVVVVAAEMEADVAKLTNVRRGARFPLAMARGGKERQDSVRAGLIALSGDVDVVLVHDAARPLVPGALVSACLDAAHVHGAATAALEVTDTIKEVDARGAVVRTHDRARLRLIQTPQAFHRRLLLDAHERASREGYLATDDAALVERYGATVWTVTGDPDNLKITTPRDLAWARWRLQSATPR